LSSLQRAAAPRALPSFPTRRSSDLLIASKGLHQQQRIGDAIPPVVMPGIETVSASAIDTSFMGHSYYGSNRAALSDLFALVKEEDRKSTRLNSSHVKISYAVFCLKK